jgi:hypothetical protein
VPNETFLFVSSGLNFSEKRSEVYPVKPAYLLFNWDEFNWGHRTLDPLNPGILEPFCLKALIPVEKIQNGEIAIQQRS